MAKKPGKPPTKPGGEPGEPGNYEQPPNGGGNQGEGENGGTGTEP